MKTPFDFPLIRTCVIALFFGAASAFAGSATWNVPTGNWRSNGNWTGGFAPFNGNNADTSWSATVGSGTATLDGAAVVLQALTLSGSSGTVNGNTDLTVNNNLTWSSGTLAGSGVTTLATGSTSTISSINPKTLSRVLNNQGTVTYNGGDSALLFLNANGPIVPPADAIDAINNSGIFNVINGGGIMKTGGNTGGVPQAINNTGSWNVSGGGTAEINTGVSFNNKGIVNLTNGGLLSIQSGGTHTGAFNLASGTKLAFRSANVLNAGSNLTGAGEVFISGGGGGTFNAGIYNITGLTNVNFGKAVFNASATTGTLNLLGNSSNGQVVVSGAGTVLTVTGAYTQSSAFSRTQLSSGGTIQAASMSIASGSLEGSGTVISNVASIDGKVSPTGTIAITGDLTLAPAAPNDTVTVEIDISSTGNDLITETGTVRFARNGKLAVRLANGFLPANNASFTVLRSNQDTTGQFSNVTAGRVDAMDAAGTTVGTFAINAANTTNPHDVVLGDFRLPNHAPTIAADQAARIVDEGPAVTNTGTFSDLDGNATVTLTASIGTVTPNNGAGTWSWSLAPTDGPLATTVTITATDSGVPAKTAITTFALTINNVAPSVANQTITVLEDSGPTTITLAAIDPGTMDPLRLELVSLIRDKEGTMGPLGGSSITFTPAPNFNGTAHQNFIAVDKDGAISSQGTLTINVTSVNDQPTLDPIADPAPIGENPPIQSVRLTGITSGARNELQNLFVTVVSDTPDSPASPLVDLLPVSYNPSDGTGTISYKIAANRTGIAHITVTVTDSGNTQNGGQNSISRTFTVTVVDLHGPTVTAPDDIVVEATGPNGATVTFPAATVSDAVSASPTVVYSKDGTPFPFGPTPFPILPTPVTVTATDAAGNTGTDTFLVTVRDTTPPVITVTGTNPTSILPGSSYLDGGATATDLVDGTRPVTTTGHVDGGVPGVYTMTYTARDMRGNVARATRTVTVLPAGTLDPDYNVDMKGGSVRAIALQPDGKAIIGGDLSISGPGGTANVIGRLNPNGTVDTTFDPLITGVIEAVAVQTDGKIVIGGSFTSVDGTPRNNIARLNSDGELDTAFTASVGSTVRCLAIQSDGKILVGGAFGGGITRLNSLNGSKDTSFTTNANNAVRCIAVDALDRIVIGGFFTQIGSTVRNRLARLTTTGALDSAFNPNANAAVLSLAAQADGKILVGGLFTTLRPAGTPLPIARNHLARLTSAGGVDGNFQPNANDAVVTMAVQTDGQILIGGDFDNVGGETRIGIARVSAGGLVDMGFDPGFNGAIGALAVQEDGKVLCGGDFNSVVGTSTVNFVRLLNRSAPQSLTILDTSRVTWLRGGSSPETMLATFEFSTNGGTTWNRLPAPTRITGGWQLSGLRLPGGVIAQLRARARTTGAAFCGSTGLVEIIAGFRLSRATLVTGLATNITSSTATLSATANANSTEPASISFEYGFDTRYNVGVLAATPSSLFGTGNRTVVASLTNLHPNTLYHYRVKAVSAAGTSFGADATFTTSPEGGVVRFASAAASVNAITTSQQPNTFPVTLLRRAGSTATSVEVLGTQPASVPTGTIKYVYGTHYRFASEVVPGMDKAEFADGETTTTVLIELLPAATAANGSFVLSLAENSGANVIEAPAITTITVVRDTKGPVITATVPGTINSPFLLTGTVKEEVALSAFTVKLNGVARTLTVSPLTNFVANANVAFSVAGLLPENGSNTITIEATDSSGNRSTVTKTTSFINNRPLLAGSYSALLVPVGPPNNLNSGIINVTLSASGTFTGSVTFMEVTTAFNGILNNAGVARFNPTLGTSVALVNTRWFASFYGFLSFSIDAINGLNGMIMNDKRDLTIATFASSLSQAQTPADLLNQGTSGVYTVAFPSKDQTPTLPASTYPQGTGIASLTLSKKGAITLEGFLADGTPFTTTSQLRPNRTVPLFIPLYRSTGFLSGELTFSSQPNSDVAAVDLTWIRPALPAADFYRDGWLSGIKLDAVGTKYQSPSLLDFGQGVANTTTGNATLRFSGGQLTTPINKPVSLNPTTGAIALIPAANTTYSLQFNTLATGLLQGTLIAEGATDAFKAVLLNKGANRGGYGFFLHTPVNAPSGTGTSGTVFLDPAGP
jgi:uncharacterized delta-60 repeat protein